MHNFTPADKIMLGFCGPAAYAQSDVFYSPSPPTRTPGKKSSSRFAPRLGGTLTLVMTTSIAPNIGTLIPYFLYH